MFDCLAEVCVINKQHPSAEIHELGLEMKIQSLSLFVRIKVYQWQLLKGQVGSQPNERNILRQSVGAEKMRVPELAKTV